jgi:O-antigen ligase
MLNMRSKKLLGTIILVAVVAVTLVMAPYTSVDPINLPKLSTLAFFSMLALSLTLGAIKTLFGPAYKPLVIVAGLFIIQIGLVLLFSGANFVDQFYGTYGRNTGAIAYFALVTLMISASIVGSRDFSKKFVQTTLIIGLFMALYGNIQYLGLEPLPFVNAYTVNAPIGTFGNPDFQSAFMGLIAVVAFTMALNTVFSKRLRGGLILLGIVSLVVVYETIAKQGYFSFLAGAGVVVMIWLLMTGRKTLGKSVAAIGVFSGGLIFLGLINIGPLANYLYKSSLEARGYYWRAAIKMVLDHPLFGVGMDGFGDWYRRSRAEEYLANGFLSVSNTAHNVYLDIASSGGFPLFALYGLLLALVIRAIAQVVRRALVVDVYFLALVGAWVAYQAQSFVSINQLGLAIWGWVLAGLIIGYEINTRVPIAPQGATPVQKNRLKGTKQSANSLSSSTVIYLVVGFLVASFVAIPPYVAATNYYSALKSGDAKKIENAAYLRPYEITRFLQVASILSGNKLEAQAITILRDASLRYPDSFELWSLWSAIPTAAPSDVAHARAEMKRLDPFNPELK